MGVTQLKGGQIGPLDLTTEVTGVLPVANGGTGSASGWTDLYTTFQQARDTSSITKWLTQFTGTLSTSTGNVFEHYINGTLYGWANEWGALRGRVPYASYADALVRGIIESGDYTGSGGLGTNFIEIVDRTLSAGNHRQLWGRQWGGGALVRNGVVKDELYRWRTGDSDPTLGGTVARPPHIGYLILLEAGDSVPSWYQAGSDVVLTFPAGAGQVWEKDLSASGGSSTWGSITGTLSSQTDLQAAIDMARDWAWSTDLGYLGWNYDPLLCTTQTAAGANGTLYGGKVWLPAGVTVSTITVVVGTAGATLVSGQNKACIFDPSGNLVGTTGDQSAVWNSTGLKNMALVSSFVTSVAGWYSVGVWANGTTRPAFSKAPGTNAAVNGKLSAANSRFYTANTGLTTTAPSTLGTKTASGGFAYWFGIS